MHPAEVYNEKRRIIFSTVHDRTRGIPAASDYLEGYRQALGPQGYAGLKAELEFYKRFKTEFGLTLAADTGDHADFAGVMNGRPVRFDVTTNLDYKSFKTYEPFLVEGYDYRIALLDRDNFEVVDVLDLAFPRCSRCGDTHAFPFLLTLGENYNRHGESTWTNDQILLDVCPTCHALIERQRFTHSGLFPVSTYAQDLEDDPRFDERAKAYASEIYSYAKKIAPVELMGLAENSYRVTDRDGGGDWILWFSFLNGVVQRYMPDSIVSGILE